jgi:hypothetical protein
MNCCSDSGKCTQGNDCPARKADAALVARIKASQPAPVAQESENIKEVLFVIGGAILIASLCVGFLIFGGK